MAISGKVKIKSINGITPEVMDGIVALKWIFDDMEISDSFKADEIVGEYNVDDLLEAIGDADVATWLSEQGYEVSLG